MVYADPALDASSLPPNEAQASSAGIALPSAALHSDPGKSFANPLDFQAQGPTGC